MNRLAIILALCATQAHAVPCLPREALVKSLDANHGEQLTGVGLADQTRVVEVWTSDKGTFTVIVSLASGMACIIAAGKNWHSVAPVKEPPT